jgi:predicted nucleic acid-binding Zn ribbon protein
MIGWKLKLLTKVKQKKCKVCATLYTPRSTTQQVCSPKCAQIHAERTRKRLDALKLKTDRKILAEKKQSLKTRSEWIKEVQVVFNRYIRERDKNKPCISCGVDLKTEAVGGGYDAGHFLSRGAKPHLRFNENNVFGQCKRCNRYLSGNVANMREGVRDRIGQQALNTLESDNTAKHYSIDDLKELKQIYTKKYTLLKR